MNEGSLFDVRMPQRLTMPGTLAASPPGQQKAVVPATRLI